MERRPSLWFIYLLNSSCISSLHSPAGSHIKLLVQSFCWLDPRAPSLSPTVFMITFLFQASMQVLLILTYKVAGEVDLTLAVLSLY